MRVYADYSQIELRMLAWITGNKTLTQAYMSPSWEAFKRGSISYNEYRKIRKSEPNVDVHGQQAIRTFGSNPEAPDWKVKRRAAKIINFGVPYGMSWMGLNSNPELLLPEDESKLYFEQYHRGNPEISQAKRALFNKMIRERHPHFVNWAGRTVHCAELRAVENFRRSSGERSTFASLVQGSAAELTRVSLVRLWYLSRTGSLPATATSTVHDEIQFDCASEDVPYVAAKVQEVMEDFHPYFGPIPVICDIETTNTNWAEKEDYEV
jgi:DNA polymerase-1